MTPGYRMIKWVGERRVLKSDGFSVANWKHENRRRFPITFGPGARGNIRRVVQSKDAGVVRDYVWDRYSQDWTIAVPFDDAMKILHQYGREFRDVTEVVDSTTIRQSPLILPRQQRVR